ncbi:MAG: bifunctional riboflavin kinase/FAD synthetase [Gammaproteobacteria bacterium]|nr:bifunctional riboflavin kinase/FAD synthetase [Gammaproteobacteria bacterium]MDH3767422.1 bifunctional riboflavin kinase/FAD synthetase [Gammaproteobacteria bacterium]
MEFIRGIANLGERHRGCILTIGNYDGVHLGHQAVLSDLVAKSRDLDCPSTVMVFEPTPQEFFAGAAAPARLTTLREKLHQFEARDIDRVLCLRFNRGVAAMTPEFFVEQLIQKELGARHVTVGDDFRFGRDRGGDFQTLVAAGEEYGFAVAATPEFLHKGKRVSSSAVRTALAQGDVQTAANFLGRDYSMSGRVRRGEQLGRRLGYPTANIAPHRRVLPLNGVFAVQVSGVDGSRLPGVASLGTRPMVDGREPLLEVHLFDFHEDLYGQYLEVSFIARLREERVFTDLHAMVEQMHDDAAQARNVLGLNPTG